MSRALRALLALGPALILALVLTSPVAAAAYVGEYHFTDCSGPGAPDHFTALKEQTPDGHNVVSSAIAFRLEDGGVFVVQSFDGFTIAKGIQDQNLVVTCTFNSIEFGPVIFMGFITPR